MVLWCNLQARVLTSSDYVKMMEEKEQRKKEEAELKDQRRKERERKKEEREAKKVLKEKAMAVQSTSSESKYICFNMV